MIFGRSVTQIFFQEICSSSGKQIIHEVSAAFIVKNCHPRTSLIFTDNLPLVLKSATGSMLADDTGTMVASQSVSDLQNLLNDDIHSVVNWLELNRV